jgi:hypothetical protein
VVKASLVEMGEVTGTEWTEHHANWGLQAI